MTLHMDYHQMVHTEIRLIIFFAAEDGEVLYSQQKIRPGGEALLHQQRSV